MKFELYKEPTTSLAIPNSALKLAEMLDCKSITAHVAEDVIALLPERMTAAEAIAAIDALSELTGGLIVALANACEEYEFNEMQKCEKSECETCAHPECCGIELPPCLLDEAGFPKSSGFEASVLDGRIIITPLTILDEEFADELPEALRKFLTENEIDVSLLRSLVEDGSEVVYGG